MSLATFWTQIDDQLDEIAATRADTFDAVRAILLGPDVDLVTDEINRNGTRSFGPDAAFFAGSGGDRTLGQALRAAGWLTKEVQESYYYVMFHPATGDELTYIEGDLLRGDQMQR